MSAIFVNGIRECGFIEALEFATLGKRIEYFNTIQWIQPTTLNISDFSTYYSHLRWRVLEN